MRTRIFLSQTSQIVEHWQRRSIWAETIFTLQNLVYTLNVLNVSCAISPSVSATRCKRTRYALGLYWTERCNVLRIAAVALNFLPLFFQPWRYRCMGSEANRIFTTSILREEVPETIPIGTLSMQKIGQSQVILSSRKHTKRGVFSRCCCWNSVRTYRKEHLYSLSQWKYEILSLQFTSTAHLI